MEKIYISLLIILSLVFTTCKNNADEGEQENITRTFELVEMTSGMIRSPDSNQELQWDESYTFMGDGTFVKMRKRPDQQPSQESGSYETTTLQDGDYYTLVYNNPENEIIGSCTANGKEVLRILNDDRIRNTWAMCDGPMMTYELTK